MRQMSLTAYTDFFPCPAFNSRRKLSGEIRNLSLSLTEACAESFDFGKLTSVLMPANV